MGGAVRESRTLGSAGQRLFPPLPHLRPCSFRRPGLDSSLNKQIIPEQAASVCLRPSRCCIGTLFAKHSLGFCGLRFGPSHFSLGLLQTPEARGSPRALRMTWGPGRAPAGQSPAPPPLLTEKVRGSDYELSRCGARLDETRTPGLSSRHAGLQTPGTSRLRPRPPALHREG